MKLRSESLVIGMVLTAILVSLTGSRLYGDEPLETKVLRQIAQEQGIAPGRLELGAKTSVQFPLIGVTLFRFKLVDAQTGEVYSTVVDESGRPHSLEDARAAERAAYEAQVGRLHPDLKERLQGMSDNDVLTVAVWLKEAEVTPLGRPMVDPQVSVIERGGAQLLAEEEGEVEHSAALAARAAAIRAEQADRRAEIEAIRQANIGHLAAQVASAQQALLTDLAVWGFEPAYVSPYAPLVYVELPKSAIQEIARRLDVDMVYGPSENFDLMDKAKPTQKAEVVDAWGFEGAGIDVAILEDSRIEFTNPYLNTGTTRVPGHANVDDHAAATAGMVASQHGTYQGIAQDVYLYSANATDYTDSNLAAAMDWAVAQNVDIINNSWGGNAGTTTLNDHDRHLDYIVRNYRRTVTVAAGNEGTATGRVTSPARGYNVISVGNYQDHDTLTWDDDNMRDSSSYIDPSTGIEKPEVAASGSSINSTTASNPWVANVGSGTSYSAPMVAGEAALLMERDSALGIWPEAVKAIIMATALHNTEGATRLSEVDGAGGVDMRAAFRVVDEGWWHAVEANADDFPYSYYVYVTAGETARAAIAWDSNPNSSYSSDLLEADIDLQVYDPNGTLVTSSTSIQNSYEVVEFTASTAGNYELRIDEASFSGTTEYIGAAWWPGHRNLIAYSPQTLDAPPISYDYYRFDASSCWNGAGIRPASGSNHDLYLFAGSAFGDPEDHDQLTSSNIANSSVDFVLVDANHAVTGNYFLEAKQISGSGDYTIEWASCSDDVDTGLYGPYTMSASQVLRVWDAYLSTSARKFLAVKPVSGNADLAMALYGSDPGTSSTWYQHRSQALAQADAAGLGEDEYLNYQPTTSDWMGLVVWSVGATGSTTFYLYADTSAPSGSISINDGASYAISTSASLSLSANDAQTGVDEMRLSNDGSTWTSWEPYTTSRSWALPSGDGSKTVYAQFKNHAGMVSSTYSDSIILDTAAPTGSIVIDGGAAYATSTSVELTLSASDSGSGVDEMRFSNDGSTWSTWEPYSGSKSWTLPSGDGSKTVYVQYRDQAGHVSSLYTDSIILDTAAPTGSILIEDGVAYAASTAVELTLSASDSGSGVDEMRFSNDGSTWSTWEPYSGSKSWTLPSGDGSKTVYVQYRDQAGHVSSSYTDSIILDTAAPTGSILIDGGAAYATSTAATLSLLASDAGSGVNDMRFSNSGSPWSAWEPYATTKAWTLPAGDGDKTVYVQYRDQAGNISSSYSDSIILDTAAPTGSILIDGGATYATSTSVILSMSANDSGAGVSEMRFSNNSTSWSAWEPYIGSKAWTLPAGDGSKTVYVQYRDNAGHTSSTYSDSIILDTITPTGSILIDGGATYATSTAVELTLSASDGTSGVDEMSFSNNGTSWDTWQPYAGSKAWTLSAGDGPKTVYVRYRDHAGNISSSYSDNIILDTAAPTGWVLIDGGAAYASSTSVELTLSASDGTSGVDEMRLSNNGTSWSAWEPYASTRSWTLPAGDGAKAVYVRYRDHAGNISSTYSDSITLDTAPPTGSILIDGGATFATSNAVELTLMASDSGSGVDEMRFSDNGTSWSAWEPYASSKSWTLSSGDGSKTVSVQYRDQTGHVSSSYSDSIILDTVAPMGYILINGGASYAITTSAILSLSANDGTSGMDGMRFSNSGSTWSAWEPYASSKAWTLPSGDGSKTVYVQYRDLAGNVSSSYTDTIILDTVAPAGSIVINGGDTYATSASVDLMLSASDGISGMDGMRFSNDGTSWSVWEPYASGKAWTLSSGDGGKTVYVQYRDLAGNRSSLYSDSIILDAVAPTGSILIDGGATYATSTDVELTLSASDETSGMGYMRFSDNGASWNAWEPYASSKSWTLVSGDGSKMVYVQYRDYAGHTSSTYGDSIILDAMAPVGGILINGGDSYATSTSVDLTLSASDGTSGMGDMRFSDNGTLWNVWESYASSKTWTLPSGDGSKTVYVQYRDQAGNISSSYTDSITLDTVAPTGSILINGGETYTASSSADLTLSASDETSGVDEMHFSSNGTSWTAWEPYGTDKAWTLASGDGTKTVYVQYVDQAGHVSSTYSDSIVLDTVAPTGSIMINGGDPYAMSASATLSLSASDAGSGVDRMHFSDDGSSWSGWEAYTGSKSWTLPSGDGSKTVYVQYRDHLGQVSSAYSDTITLDTTPPNSGATSPASTTSDSFVVSWSGTDNLTGIATYDVQYRVGSSGSWSSWLSEVSESSAVFGPASSGQTYYFQVRARDNAGNLEAYPGGDGDTSTFVQEVFLLYLPLTLRGF